MTMLASQITSLTVVYSIVYSGVNQRKHQSSASLAFVWQIHRGPVNFPHKWPVTRKMFPFDDVIMISQNWPRYWFGSVRQQAITRVSVDRFMSPYCATMCWVTVLISMALPALATHLWGETTDDRLFSQTEWCAAFVFALLSVWIICCTNSRVAHGWRRHDANVISLYWLLVIFF